MKPFKTLIMLSVSLCVISLNSCKKDSSSVAATNTISANVDGTLVNFTVGASATKATVNGATLTGIQGTSASGANISIILSGVVTAGKVFSDNATDDNDKPLINYSTTSDGLINDDSVTSNIPSVTITAISSTSIQGTFTGNLSEVEIGNGTPVKKALTNGKFNVSFK